MNNLIQEEIPLKAGGQVPAPLLEAADAIMNGQDEVAAALLSSFEPADDISRICAQAILGQKKGADHIYLSGLTDKDKQINVFDLVLQNVDSVRVATGTAFNMMRDFYSQGQRSFTHFNIGIGKGHFEVQLIKALAEGQKTLPSLIKMVGLDIDEYSLKEAGENISRAATQYLPPDVKVEYTAICAFAEKVPEEMWEQLREHETDSLGVISAFTLHHLSAARDRHKVLSNIAACRAGVFLQIEPDVNHFTPDLRDRLVNCWTHFGTLFKLIDQKGLQEVESNALKYLFFKREIEDILSSDESSRFEKHEDAPAWTERCKRAGFYLIDLPYQVSEEIPGFTYHYGKGHIRMTYEEVPMVAVIMATLY
ncbi:GRAS family protein [Nafulsella turpanensis]|uniref:GRAS family protein n=1 Tax=Nafulsella turpanensis TaxID=1265690 RepID=UPI00034A1FE7|nr:GRAS family protein [Nafulsella turpanensis]